MRSNRRMRFDDMGFNVITRCLTGACLVFFAQFVNAQESDLAPQTTPASQVSADEVKTLEATYLAKAEAWRKTVELIGQTRIRYFDSTRSESEDLRDDWDRLKTEGRAQLQETVVAAKALFDAQEKPSIELALFIGRVQQKSLAEGFAAEAFRLGEKLVDVHPNVKEFQLLTAMAAIKVNEFDFAKKFFDENGEMLAKIDSKDIMLFKVLDELITEFEREKEFRKSDANSNLPRVAIETNRGTITVELFEDQAPNTVANFISLTEQGFYDRKVFHWALKDLLAETGVASLGQPPPIDIDYCIADEFDREDARHHFRGSLSLGKSDEPNSGNERFFLCIQPVPFLDGKHTVFGRIVEGLDVLDNITRTHKLNEEDKPEPIPEVRYDLIVKATVLRKRPDSEYKIDKVPRPKPEVSQ